MSTDWFPGEPPTATDGDTDRGEDATGDPVPRSRLGTAGAVAAVLALAVAIAVVVSRPWEQRAGEPLARTTLVGSITWSRVDGDPATLPARVVGVADAELIGDDENGRRWRSADGGRSWRADDVFDVERRVGDVDWIVHHERGRTTLAQASAAGTVPVVTDHAATAIVDGLERKIEVVTPDGFPIDVASGTYLLTRESVRLPWERITEVALGGSYRVALRVGTSQVRVVAGDFREMSVSEFEMVAAGFDHRHDIVDQDGVTVWAFEIGSEAHDPSALEIVQGASTTTWSEWQGAGFVPVDTPWRSTDRVDIAVAAGGVLARTASAADRTVDLWWSRDGRVWGAVLLPERPTDGAPLTIHQGDGEATVTALTERGRVSWATSDGVDFEELPQVSGVATRSRGAFGWAAPDERHPTRLHVSADGSAWQAVDLRDLLDLDATGWDATIDVRAVGAGVYVVVSRPGSRTLLIGEIDPLG